MDPNEITGAYIPKSIPPERERSYVRRSVGDLDGRCLKVKSTPTGKWVCLLPAGHEATRQCPSR